MISIKIAPASIGGPAIEPPHRRPYRRRHVRSTTRRRRRLRALPQAVVALHLRYGRADREPRRAAHSAASAGAGPGARHGAPHGAAFPERHAQDRPVLAEPDQGTRPPRRSAALGGALSRLGTRCATPARPR